jgi:CO dehydrogenase maturation factor
MKVSFVGKGGSGKTTLSALTARYLAKQSKSVLAIDADINQHLGESLGMSQSEADSVPPMGLEMERIQEYLHGSNKRVESHKAMIKTTPPGTGSRLLTVNEENPVYDHFVRKINGVHLMAVGPFEKSDLGVKCYHSKTGSVELLLNHLIDRQDEYVVVDMTAGADAFASGLFTRFDVTFLVVEPTVKSVGVFEQYRDYAKDHDVTIKVIANKCHDNEDISFIRERVGDRLVASFSHSDYVRAMDKGKQQPLKELEDENKVALEKIVSTIDAQQKDWETYYRQAKEFHKKNAESWANESAGKDLADQIDPNFSLQSAVEKM